MAAYPWVMKTGLAILVLLAATELALRGPIRFLRANNFNDFVSPYVQARLLAKGLDPYSAQNLVLYWPKGMLRPDFLEKELADGSLIVNRGIPTAYPLTTFLLLVPFAVCPWPVAYVAWVLTSVLLTFCMIWCLVSLAGLRANEWRFYLFVALALALAPLHTGLATGAITIPAIALCGIAVASADRREIIAGILLGLATCLKPQIGLPFLLFYLLRRRWHLSGVALGLVFVAASSATARLVISNTSWIENYRLDNRVLLQTGILSDFTERNPLRFSLVNLQVLLYALLRHPGVIDALALIVTGGMFLAWFFSRRRRKNHDDLLELSLLVIVSLLPVYHRFYDASLLVLPLCWSLREFYGPLRLYARGTLALILPFLVPGGSALEQWQPRGYIPQVVAHSSLWNAIVMPHQVWTLLVTCALLLWATSDLAGEDRFVVASAQSPTPG